MLQLEQHTEEDRLQPDDIEHWLAVYRELVTFLHNAAVELGPGPVRDELEARANVYSQRLLWWRDFRDRL